MKASFVAHSSGILLGLGLFAASPAQSYALPADCPRATVQCSRDGQQDCTQAIRDAIAKTWSAWEVIYLPQGIYLVSDRIDYGRFLTIRGDGPGKTIIRLKTGASGFGSKSSPRAVVRAWRGCCEIGGAHDNTTHSIHLMNLTVDVGDNNPGAIGIDWIAHNGGGIENVEIRSGSGSGYKGISLDRDANGPCLINRVKISGFDIGISAGSGVYGTTFEDITLENQRVVGIKNGQHPISIRRLVSTNSVPAIQSVSTSYGLLLLLDSQLKGGSSSNLAIESQGSLYARNVVAEGYRSVLKDGTKEFPGRAITEYSSREIQLGTPNTPRRSLCLPVKNMYLPQLDPPSEWVSVRKYESRKVGSDWAPAIQAAIDEGKKTVYFPSTTHAPYTCSQNVIVRGAVRNIIGMYAALGSGKLVFETTDRSATIYVEQVRADAGIVHNSPSTVVLRRCMGGTIQTNPGAGDLFIDDWCCGNLDVNGSNVWARQFNEESNRTKLHVKSGNLWLLGYKTEQYSMAGHFEAGAAAEILGYLIYPAQGTGTIMYTNDNSAFAAFHREVGAGYTTFAKELHDGTTRTVNPAFTGGTFYASNPRGIGGDPSGMTDRRTAPARHCDRAPEVMMNGSVLRVDFDGPVVYAATLVDLNGTVLARAAGYGASALLRASGHIGPGVYLARVSRSDGRAFTTRVVSGR